MNVYILDYDGTSYRRSDAFSISDYPFKAPEIAANSDDNGSAR